MKKYDWIETPDYFVAVKEVKKKHFFNFFKFIIKEDKTHYLLFLAIVMILIFVLNVYQHELVHKEIFETYGIESEIIPSFFDGDNIMAYTQPINITSEEFNEKCDANCRLSHDITEAIGYQLQGAMMGIMFLFTMYIFYKLFFEDKDIYVYI